MSFFSIMRLGKKFSGAYTEKRYTITDGGCGASETLQERCHMAEQATSGLAKRDVSGLAEQGGCMVAEQDGK